jgi:uncharacterized protein
MTRFGLSLMPEASFAQAALPLFESGCVEVIEWSFDTTWGPSGPPGWLTSLLVDYSADGALVGHGVSYSLLDARDTPHHERWLQRLRQEVAQYTYQWISEHVGFLGSDRFSFTSPLPMPVCAETIALAQRRVAALHDAANCPVGLENLATTLTIEDATDQGRFLRETLEPTNGFMVLDLHNLWAQALNTNRDAYELADSYPLDRVREIHVSGGSWSYPPSAQRPIRRDTHDDVVPVEVRELLQWAMRRCPSLELIVYERLGTTLTDPSSHANYRDDVQRIRELVA